MALRARRHSAMLWVRMDCVPRVRSAATHRRVLAALLESCDPKTKLCVAADLTLESEQVRTKSIAEWRRGNAAVGKRPAVFLLFAA